MEAFLDLATYEVWKKYDDMIYIWITSLYMFFQQKIIFSFLNKNDEPTVIDTMFKKAHNST